MQEWTETSTPVTQVPTSLQDDAPMLISPADVSKLHAALAEVKLFQARSLIHTLDPYPVDFKDTSVAFLLKALGINCDGDFAEKNEQGYVLFSFDTLADRQRLKDILSRDLASMIVPVNGDELVHKIRSALEFRLNGEFLKTFIQLHPQQEGGLANLSSQELLREVIQQLLVPCQEVQVVSAGLILFFLLKRGKEKEQTQQIFKSVLNMHKMLDNFIDSLEIKKLTQNPSSFFMQDEKKETSTELTDHSPKKNTCMPQSGEIPKDTDTFSLSVSQIDRLSAVLVEEISVSQAYRVLMLSGDVYLRLQNILRGLNLHCKVNVSNRGFTLNFLDHKEDSARLQYLLNCSLDHFSINKTILDDIKVSPGFILNHQPLANQVRNGQWIGSGSEITLSSEKLLSDENLLRSIMWLLKIPCERVIYKDETKQFEIGYVQCSAKENKLASTYYRNTVTMFSEMVHMYAQQQRNIDPIIRFNVDDVYYQQDFLTETQSKASTQENSQAQETKAEPSFTL